MTTHESPVSRAGGQLEIMSRLAGMNTLWITIALLLEIAFFAFWLPAGTFLTTFNFQTITADSAVLLILAAAATLVIITGGIDVSIGSTLTLSSVVAANVMAALAPGSEALAVAAGVVAGIAVGLLVGFFNGYLVAYWKIPSFVVTLGSLSIALGIARLASRGVGTSGAPEAIRMFGQGQWLGIPVVFLIAVGVILLFTFILEKTRFGEHTYFIGSSAEAAIRGGINAPLQTALLYVISGGLAGAAGVIEFARFEVASVSTGHTTSLIAAIAAVVIGGGSLFGGVGTVRGSAIGVFIPVLLANGLLIGGIERFWQDVITGFILILAVAFDQWRRKTETSR